MATDAIETAFLRTAEAQIASETPATPAIEPTVVTPTPAAQEATPTPTPTPTPTEVVSPTPIDSGVNIRKIETPEPTAAPTFDWKAEFKKEAGIDWEEAQKVIKAPKQEFTELAKRLNEAEKLGKTKEFLQMQSTDWDTEPEERIVKASLKKEYGLGDEDINQLFESRYKLNEEEFSPSEVATAKILLKADAAKFRQVLKSEQVAAFEGYKSPEPTAEQKEQQRLADIETQRIKAEAFELHGKLNELEVVLPDKGVAVTFPITTEQKEQMKPYLQDPQLIFNQFYSKEGKWDNQKWVRFVADMVTREQALPAMLSKYANSVLDEDVKQRKNFTLDKDGKQIPAATPEVDAELKKYFAVR